MSSKASSRRSSDTRSHPSDRESQSAVPRSLSSRRSFIAGAGAAALGVGMFADVPLASAHRRLSKGDEALLRFPAALETLEADFWQQYNELGGIQDSEVPGGTGNPAYTAALSVLDSDMAQYVHDNTDDEITHFTFLNAYLEARGGKPVDLEPFRTLPSSTATGAQQIPRLTNLMQLTLDTSWWTRYRSSTNNPDVNPMPFTQAVPDLHKGQFTAIPRTDADLFPEEHIQAIANTAAFQMPTGKGGMAPSFIWGISWGLLMLLLGTRARLVASQLSITRRFRYNWMLQWPISWPTSPSHQPSLSHAN